MVVLGGGLFLMSEVPMSSDSHTGDERRQSNGSNGIPKRALPTRGPHTRTAYMYRGTSRKRNSASLGPYSRNMPRVLWGLAFSYGRGTPVQGYLAHKKRLHLVPYSRPLHPGKSIFHAFLATRITTQFFLIVDFGSAQIF
jgi:hypothetical protein